MPESSPSPSAELPPPPPDDTVIVVEHTLRRLDWTLVGEATLGFFSMERGFWFTLRGFAFNPRSAFEGYLGKERLRFNNPLKLVIFLSALTAFLSHQFEAFHLVRLDGEAGVTRADAAQATFLQQNYNLLMLASLPVMALLSWLCYRKRVYNVLEHLALNAFHLSVSTAAYLAMLPLILRWPGGVLATYSLLALGYQTWVYRRVLGPGWLGAAGATLATTVVYLAMVTLVSTVLVAVD